MHKPMFLIFPKVFFVTISPACIVVFTYHAHVHVQADRLADARKPWHEEQLCCSSMVSNLAFNLPLTSNL